MSEGCEAPPAQAMLAAVFLVGSFVTASVTASTNFEANYEGLA